jgi:hypothetical protein
VRAVLERVRVKGDMDKRAGVVQQLGTFKGTYSELKETQRMKRDTTTRYRQACRRCSQSATRACSHVRALSSNVELFLHVPVQHLYLCVRVSSRV